MNKTRYLTRNKTGLFFPFFSPFKKNRLISKQHIASKQNFKTINSESV